MRCLFRSRKGNRVISLSMRLASFYAVSSI